MMCCHLTGRSCQFQRKYTIWKVDGDLTLQVYKHKLYAELFFIFKAKVLIYIEINVIMFHMAFWPCMTIEPIKPVFIPRNIDLACSLGVNFLQHTFVICHHILI